MRDAVICGSRLGVLLVCSIELQSIDDVVSQAAKTAVKDFREAFSLEQLPFAICLLKIAVFLYLISIFGNYFLKQFRNALMMKIIIHQIIPETYVVLDIIFRGFITIFDSIFCFQANVDYKYADLVYLYYSLKEQKWSHQINAFNVHQGQSFYNFKEVNKIKSTKYEEQMAERTYLLIYQSTQRSQDDTDHIPMIGLCEKRGLGLQTMHLSRFIRRRVYRLAKKPKEKLFQIQGIKQHLKDHKKYLIFECTIQSNNYSHIFMKKQEQLIAPLNETSEDLPSVSKESREYLQGLEGECKIKSHSLLSISYLKIFCIAIPFALTFIGILLIYHYKKIRVRLSFSKVKHSQQNFNQVTHVYAQSQSGIDAICPVYQVHSTGKIYKLFRFEELIYELKDSEFIPLGINVKEEIQLQLEIGRGYSEGLGEEQIKERQQLYGKNEHLVKIPSYHHFLFNALTSLNLGILYLNALITFIQYSLLYSLLLLTLSFLTININYLLTNKFYRKIKAIAEKDYSVRLIRMGKQVEIMKSQLVPGDIYRLDTEIPCDSILLSGGAIVNESGFTGQNIPVGKFAIEQSKRVFQQQHWVYEGSPLISHRQNTYAMVISTAFGTRKGKIIRKILHANSSTSQFFRSILPFIGEVVVVHILLFAVFFHYMFKDIDNSTIIYLRFGEFLISSIPSFLQIEENLYKSIYLIRLNNNGIFGTDAQMTIESSRVQTICFDKTGTLTLNQIVLQSVLLAEPTGSFTTLSSQKMFSDMNVLRIFASCHNVQVIDKKLSGDQVDVKMFLATGATVSPGKQGEAFVVQKAGLRLRIIRVNQFQSRYQSMSVLLVDQNTGERFVFAKGSPEKLHALSTTKNSGFQSLIKQLSLEGYRTIAFSMRKIDNEQEFARLLETDREQCLQLTSLFGLVTFSNALKEDAAETIAILTAAEIKAKIVTGDNLFVAIQTALTLGIVPHGQRIIALEGAQFKDDGTLPATTLRQENSKLIEELIVVSPDGKELEGQNIAMDLQYILRKEATFLKNNVVVFARTTPEMKAFILQKEKEKIESAYLARSWKSRTFGDRPRKVVMVGDGANDLMALRQAHVGIGISESDAVYCSDFTVATLSKIPLLIAESRAGEQRLFELTHFYYIYRFLDMVCKILQTQDFAIYPPNTGIIRNFLTEVALCVALAFGVSSNRLNKYIPSFNMLGLHNQLTYWGSSLIVAAGISTGYYYFRQTPTFIPNPDPSQLGYNCQTATITMIFNIVLSIFINTSIVQSRPWKQRIWKNTISMLLLAANIVFITVVIFNLSSFGALGLLALQESDTLICFLIVIGFGAVCLAFNGWVQSLKLYKK